MKAVLADMGIKLELSVKQMTEIAADDAIIRKESITTVKRN